MLGPNSKMRKGLLSSCRAVQWDATHQGSNPSVTPYKKKSKLQNQRFHTLSLNIFDTISW